MAELQYFDFERPVIAVEEELKRLRELVEAGDLAHVSEVERLEKRLEKIRGDVYENLSAYQRVKLSRHFERPFTLDYIGSFITDFVELHGDRLFADDSAIVAGLGKFNSRPVVVVGHQRGRTTKERVSRNFGMTMPEGNRKAMRCFRLAEKFSLPLLLFIDTQGAYPGFEAEARGQAEAIARNLLVLASLKTIIVSTVIGEGGSGGALALGICDRLLMMENATYSVITPEGCASILWGKDKNLKKMGEYTEEAAESLKLTSKALAKTDIVDEIVQEPPGGAHRDRARAADLLEHAIAKHLSELSAMPIDEVLALRYEKYRRIGAL